jgi:hypothetical protein
MVLQKPRNVLKFTAKKALTEISVSSFYQKTEVERTTETNERKSCETKIKFEVINQQ